MKRAYASWRAVNMLTGSEVATIARSISPAGVYRRTLPPPLPLARRQLQSGLCARQSLCYLGTVLRDGGRERMRRRRHRTAPLTPVRVSGLRFVSVGQRRRRTFVPRGFNFDWTMLDGCTVRLEDLLDGRIDKLATDFSAMRRLG